jgi:hypothetical protein
VKTQSSKLKTLKYRAGSALILIVISMLVLATLGLGMLTASYGVRYQAIRLKNESAAMLAAEAGYERAIFWMSQQQDMLGALKNGVPGTSGTLSFPDGSCNYQIKFYSFLGSRPVYRVISQGTSGIFDRTVNVKVIQAISGWDMGLCRVPLSMKSTSPVNFTAGEIIDMPVHINEQDDVPDERDIYFTGDPDFYQAVAMGEARHTDGGYDKYSSVMGYFDSGICFEQPDCRIMDEPSVQSKVDRFKDSTKTLFTYKPTAKAPVPSSHGAVQLEFFVENGVGKVRITDDCTVRGYQRNSDYKTYDYKIKPGSSPETSYIRYDCYSYHYMPDNATAKGLRVTKNIEDTYVSQVFDGVESEPGGQIFIDGDVIIGGNKTDHNGDQVVKGKVTVVATGNIWIADSLTVDGAHDADGKPSKDNPNILGLISQGVVKVVDPGISEYKKDFTNNYPGPPPDVAQSEYVPIGRHDEGEWVWERVGWKWEKVYKSAEEYERHLPDPMVLEASLTVGGGGWGAENVKRKDYGGRKEADGDQDKLIVRGTIAEAIRGVVGSSSYYSNDGFLKQYYFDERLLEGILPGDIWLRGKYIPAPAGWHDYRAKSMEEGQEVKI